jgi:hypothetical protein
MTTCSRFELNNSNDDSSWVDLDSIFDDEVPVEEVPGWMRQIDQLQPLRMVAPAWQSQAFSQGLHGSTEGGMFMPAHALQFHKTSESHGSSTDASLVSALLFFESEPLVDLHRTEGMARDPSQGAPARMEQPFLPQAASYHFSAPLVKSRMVASELHGAETCTAPVSLPISSSDSIEDAFETQKLLSSSDPPVRALSAYNFFFRDERNRILNGGKMEFSLARQNELLEEHWGRSRTEKRRHRKSHGKIDFTTLSRRISSEWKNLDDTGKAFYKRIAALDWHRFRRELEMYKRGSLSGEATSNKETDFCTHKQDDGHFLITAVYRLETSRSTAPEGVRSNVSTVSPSKDPCFVDGFPDVCVK